MLPNPTRLFPTIGDSSTVVWRLPLAEEHRARLRMCPCGEPPPACDAGPRRIAIEGNAHLSGNLRGGLWQEWHEQMRYQPQRFGERVKHGI